MAGQQDLAGNKRSCFRTAASERPWLAGSTSASSRIRTEAGHTRPGTSSLATPHSDPPHLTAAAEQSSHCSATADNHYTTPPTRSAAT